MIHTHGLKKGYRGPDRSYQEVLDGVDLAIGPGELVAIIGRSGSGKSTLLKLIGGLDSDYQGQIEVDGIRLDGLSDRARSTFRNQTIGFVFQSFHLIDGLTAIENLTLPSLFGSVPRSSDRTFELLQKLGLWEKRARPVRELSGGEQQRVAIGRALYASPKVLLCDEPTGNLDQQTGAEVLGLLQQTSRSGTAVLVATHEEKVTQAASVVLKLSSGRLS